MGEENWYSKKYDDFIRLIQLENYWQGKGDGFEFRRHTKEEAVMLMISWGYKKL